MRVRAVVALSWAAAGVGDLALAATSCDPPAGGPALAVLAGWCAAGLAAARWGPADWRGSPAWPGVLLVAAAALRWPEAAAARAAAWALVPLVSVVLVRVLDDLAARAPALAPPLALLLALVARGVELFSAPVLHAPARLAEQLAAPLRRAAPADAARPPAVLLTVDTLRADHAVATRTWRRLAARCATWARASSTASWTVPALASVWTGLPPGEHGAGLRPSGTGFSAIRAEAPALARELRAAGWRTAAFVTNPFVSSELGFRRGFDTWVHPSENPPHRLLLLPRPAEPADGADRVVARALRWLERQPAGGWLLWVHLFDPHLPYAHAPADSRSRAIRSLSAVRAAPPEPAFREDVRRDYAEEVAHADAALLRLLDALEARGALDRALLVLAADHGEELWDHGGFEHGHSHHGEVVDVALAACAPGLAPGPRDTVASLLDVAPTVRAFAGLPPGPGPGLDLRAPLPPDRIVAAAGNLYEPHGQRSARDARWRAIATPTGDGGYSLVRYDLAADPGERTPLPVPAGDPVAAAALAARTAAEAGEAAAAPVNVEALRALGYLEEEP